MSILLSSRKHDEIADIHEIAASKICKIIDYILTKVDNFTFFFYSIKYPARLFRITPRNHKTDENYNTLTSRGFLLASHKEKHSTDWVSSISGNRRHKVELQALLPVSVVKGSRAYDYRKRVIDLNSSKSQDCIVSATNENSDDACLFKFIRKYAVLFKTY